MDPSGGGRQGNLKRPAGDLGNSDSAAQSGVVGASSSHDRPPVQWSPGVGAGHRDYDRSIVRDDGIPNWSRKERVARFKEYVEIVDRLLSDEVTTYKGRYYEVNGAVMTPRPVQQPRPPLVIAAMGPIMLKYAAQYAD